MYDKKLMNKDRSKENEQLPPIFDAVKEWIDSYAQNQILHVKLRSLKKRVGDVLKNLKRLYGM